MSSFSPEDVMSGGYSSEELQASVPADRTAMLPYIDDDSSTIGASTPAATGQTAPPAGDHVMEIRAIGIAASLVGYSGAMDEDNVSRAFIQQLDAIDSPALRTAVKARFEAMSGQTLEGFIRNNDDWNDDDENRDQAAALQLIGESRDRTQAALAELGPDERRAKQARADHVASELAAAALAHDDSTENVAKIHRLLGGCDALEMELVRSAIRRNFGGARNLYQLVDDGMDEADSDEEDVAIEMLEGDRVASAKAALAHEADKGDEADPERLREIVGGLTPDELAELNSGWFKYGVLGKIENSADRAELDRRIAGDEAGANAERIANLFAEHVEPTPYHLAEIDELNNERRTEENVLAEVEAMSGAEVKAAADAWRVTHPGQPFEIMIAKRWGDDPEIFQRLMAMVEGDKGENRALRFQHALLERDQEALEAALERERFDPADLASEDPDVRARAEALRDEEASFEQHNQAFDGLRAELLDDEPRSTSEQLDEHYGREARDAAELSTIARVIPGFGEVLSKQLLDGAHDDRIGGREMLEEGELSTETRFHRAEDVDAKAAVLESLKSNDELDAANAGYRTKYSPHYGHADMYSEVDAEDIEDMTASEKKIDDNRRYGVAEERSIAVRYLTLVQLDAIQRSAELEVDEADRQGGGTQLGTRQILGALRAQLEDTQPGLLSSELHDPLQRPVIDEDARDTTILVAQSRLDELGRDADDGLRDGASREDAVAIAGSADAMLVAQRDAKKRLAERKARIFAILGKIAAALTANPALVMLINLSSNLMQMAIKADTMGESYDPAEDAKLAAIDALVDGVTLGGKLLKHETVASVVGTGISTVASGGSIEDFSTGIAGSIAPGMLGEAAGGKLAGDIVEQTTGFGINVASGGDVGEAALDAMIGFGGSQLRRSIAGPEIDAEIDASIDAPIDAPEEMDPAPTENSKTDDGRAGASSTLPAGARDDRQLVNTPELVQRAEARLEAMSPDERAIAERALARARTPEHRAILERSLAAGDTAEQVDTMWMMSHQMSKEELKRDLTGAGHLQHYAQSCVPSAYQTALADTSPRYAGWLLNNDAAAMDQQRSTLVALGGAQTPRPPESASEVYRAAVADPEFAALQSDPARFSDHGSKAGVAPEDMVGTALHADLEDATGARYEVSRLRHAPVDRIESALAAQRPVLYSMFGHESVIVGRTPDGRLIIHDPAPGTTITPTPEEFAQLAIETVTLPVP